MSQDKLRVALLRDLEWCLDIEGRCPSCMQYEANGHAPDCRLAKVLKDDPTPAGPGLREAVALALWHRFAPAHHIDWKDEPHRAEYLDAADGVLALALQSEVAGEQELREALENLTNVVRTILEEGTSDAIFGGQTTAQRRHNSLIYAARILAEAEMLEDTLAAAEAALAQPEVVEELSQAARTSGTRRAQRDR